MLGTALDLGPGPIKHIKVNQVVNARGALAPPREPKRAEIWSQMATKLIIKIMFLEGLLILVIGLCGDCVGQRLRSEDANHYNILCFVLIILSSFRKYLIREIVFSFHFLCFYFF